MRVHKSAHAYAVCGELQRNVLKGTRVLTIVPPYVGQGFRADRTPVIFNENSSKIVQRVA